MPALPNLDTRFDAMSSGFAREGLFRQGIYQPGGRPTLFDPAWSRQRLPEAVLRHEEVHQDLGLLTFHGVLTLILLAYGRVTNARAALAACYREQWVVQELGATYAELAFMQRRVAPSDFAACIDALPSAAHGGEPYREAFDFANWLLPLDETAHRERFDPRTFVIGALCSCSMGTACLRTLASSAFDDARFAAWITNNSPRARLELIARAAGPAFFLEMTQLLARRLSAAPTSRQLLELFDELSQAMLARGPTLMVEPLSQLQSQAQAAVDRLRNDCPSFVFDLAEARRRRGPLFTESPEKRKLLDTAHESLLVQQFGFDDLAHKIDDWLQACQNAGGLHVLSGYPGPGIVPSISFVCIPSFPGKPIPDDLRVRLRPQEFFECVKRFPGFPNVMTMIGDGWLYWKSYLSVLPEGDWARKRVNEAIRITVHKSLSRELLQRLLLHEDLYDGARCILLGHERGGAVALFDNPKVNAVYALQKIDSEPALAVLKDFLRQHKVEQIKHLQSVVDFELLYWIIEREFHFPGLQG